MGHFQCRQISLGLLCHFKLEHVLTAGWNVLLFKISSGFKVWLQSKCVPVKVSLLTFICAVAWPAVCDKQASRGCSQPEQLKRLIRLINHWNNQLI